MSKVIIYSTIACPYCVMAKDFFKENNIEYVEYNVADNIKAREEMIVKSGQMGVPVIDIEGQIVIGFDEGKIKELLGIK